MGVRLGSVSSNEMDIDEGVGEGGGAGSAQRSWEVESFDRES